MLTNFTGANPYHDTGLAHYYAGLGYDGTYMLAVRDLPDIIVRQVRGHRALDFACGGGRSTRFLKALDFDAVGVDVSESMLAEARRLDPDGRYEVVGDGDLSALGATRFDLVLAAYPFDNAASRERMTHLLAALRERLEPDGRLIVVGSMPDLYRHEWLTFTAAPFPENLTARSGDPVRIAFRDRADRPVTDVLWTDADYHAAYADAGLDLLESHRPTIKDEPGAWISERTVAPWRVDVLGATGA